MKNIKNILVLIITLFASQFVLADPRLIAEMKQTFESHYDSGKCGDNIIGLLDRADLKGINLKTAKIIQIENKGFSVFGMVNVEFARDSGYHGAPGEMNWFHHIILEKDGLIYDFDFGNTPNVTSVKQYFEKMFLVEKTRSEGSDHYVGREEKLKTYEITVLPALETLNARRTRVVSPDGQAMKLGRYLGQ